MIHSELSKPKWGLEWPVAPLTVAFADLPTATPAPFKLERAPSPARHLASQSSGTMPASAKVPSRQRLPMPVPRSEREKA